jgi:hypothetical protein
VKVWVELVIREGIDVTGASTAAVVLARISETEPGDPPLAIYTCVWFVRIVLGPASVVIVETALLLAVSMIGTVFVPELVTYTFCPSVAIYEGFAPTAIDDVALPFRVSITVTVFEL